MSHGLLVLAAVVLSIIAMVMILNPERQFREARDAQRKADIDTIIEALTAYADAHGGQLPVTIPSSPTPICRSGINLDCRGLINVNAVTGSALPAIPADPKAATATSTAYTISRIGREITIAAPSTEEGETIVTTRVLKFMKP